MLASWALVSRDWEQWGVGWGPYPRVGPWLSPYGPLAFWLVLEATGRKLGQVCCGAYRFETTGSMPVKILVFLLRAHFFYFPF